MRRSIVLVATIDRHLHEREAPTGNEHVAPRCIAARELKNVFRQTDLSGDGGLDFGDHVLDSGVTIHTVHHIPGMRQKFVNCTAPQDGGYAG